MNNKNTKNKNGIFIGLRFKSLVMILVFISSLMIAVIGVLESYVRKTLIAESIEKGAAIAKSLAAAVADPIQSNDDLALFSSVNGITGNRGVVYGFIESGGMIKAHTNMDMTNKDYSPAGEVLKKDGSATVRITRGSDTIYDIAVPITSREGKLGEAHIGFSQMVVDEVIRDVRQKILYLAVGALFLGGLGALGLSSVLVKPIKLLAKGVKSIGDGNFHQRIDIKRRDEIGELTDAFNDMAKGLEEREFIKDTFKKFVHTDIVDDLLKNPDKIKVGGERKKVTVVFTDVRGFTTLSEKIPPEEVVAMLNEYFTNNLKVVNSFGGVLDKFIGDAMMITFGVPFEAKDDTLRAVKTGIFMRKAVRDLNIQRMKLGKFPIQMGIGINTGYVIAGNVGSEDRMEYTVLGDVVNIAARVEGLSREMEVIVTENTYNEIKDKVIAIEKGEVALKGKTVPVKVYEIHGIKDA
ncbi:MAG: HAMP domain-containing protein [Deltaproteobacteria bacterium]|nr:HAMP domain-containing protein [Deltaproteobacteria bacterium]